MITVYSSDTCAPCKTLKRYLDTQDIPYEVRNADEEPHATELLELAGGRLLPTTVIGRNVIRGLNIPAIRHALEELYR